VYVILPGRQPFNYQLCTGLAAADQLTLSPKVNWQMMAVLAVSGATHIFGKLKMKGYKYKQKKLLESLSQSMKPDTPAMADLGSDAFNLLIFLSVSSVSTIANHLDPLTTNCYPYYLFIYFYNFVLPVFLIVNISFIYYVRHDPLRKSVFRQLNSKLTFFSVRN
jgi:hypothetical protein